MKTVEELAKEYADNECISATDYYDDVYYSFIEGYNKAKEWIPAECSLPENDKTILIEVDMNDGEHIITTGQFSGGRFYSDLERLNPLIKYKGVQVVSWRNID